MMLRIHKSERRSPGSPRRGFIGGIPELRVYTENVLEVIPGWADRHVRLEFSNALGVFGCCAVEPSELLHQHRKFMCYAGAEANVIIGGCDLVELRFTQNAETEGLTLHGVVRWAAKGLGEVEQICFDGAVGSAVARVREIACESQLGDEASLEMVYDEAEKQLCFSIEVAFLATFGGVVALAMRTVGLLEEFANETRVVCRGISPVFLPSDMPENSANSVVESGEAITPKLPKAA